MKRLLVLSVFSIVFSSCVASEIPVCPLDDAYEYLSCADPHFSWNNTEIEPEERKSELGFLTDWTTSYCSDTSIKWIPVLDRYVKESVLKSRKVIRDRLKDADEERMNAEGVKLSQQDHDLLEQELKSLKDRKLFSYVLGLYLQLPVLRAKNEGVSNKEICVVLFERIEASGAVENDVQKSFFSEYDFYFDHQ